MWRSYIDYFLFFPPNCTLMNNLYKIKKSYIKSYIFGLGLELKLRLGLSPIPTYMWTSEG